MLLSKAPFKRWLKQQHQALSHCHSALLVHTPEGGTPEVVAQLPEHSKPHPQALGAIKEALLKKRLHLAAIEDGQMLMAQPVLMQTSVWGVIVVCIEVKDKKEVPASLKIIQQGMSWLHFLLAQQEKATAPNIENKTAPTITADASTPAATQQPYHAAQLLQLTNILLKEKSLQETAIGLVNFLATQLQSSRVCLGLQGKKGTELLAVSFSAHFDKRTKAMQAISDAMDEAADQRTPIHVDAENSASIDTVSRCHQELLALQKVACLDSFLLRKNTQVLGVITIEQSNKNLSEQQLSFIDAALLIVSDIFAIKKENEIKAHQQFTSYLVKRLSPLFGQQNTLSKLIGAGLLMGFFTLFIPANYWLTCDASLQSQLKYLVISPQDGYLSSIQVRPGATVVKGDVLAQLNDEDLRLERRKLFSQLQQSQQEYDNALANANRVQAAIANEKITQANSQLQLVEQQQMRTQLVAPDNGIITSDDISQSLGAPVKQGQVIFEISAGKNYLVQLWVDEKDIAALKVNQTGHIKLASLPNDTFDITVSSITPISEIREGKNYFRVEAIIKQASELIRPGMTGTGKVLTGKKTLGWIWFHDLWYWLRLKLWL